MLNLLALYKTLKFSLKLITLKYYVANIEDIQQVKELRIIRIIQRIRNINISMKINTCLILLCHVLN